MAGALFVLPSLFILIALSWVYIAFGDVPLVAGLFYGIKPAVTAIVLQAAWRIGSRALQNGVLWAIAAASFVAIFALGLPFPASLEDALVRVSRRPDGRVTVRVAARQPVREREVNMVLVLTGRFGRFLRNYQLSTGDQPTQAMPPRVIAITPLPALRDAAPVPAAPAAPAPLAH